MKSMIKVVRGLLLACSITACIVFGAHASESAAEAARVSRAERLYEAIADGGVRKVERVRELLNAKADVNAIIYDEPMIQHACAYGDVRTLKLLLDYKANVNAASKVDGGTVLHTQCDATAYGSNDIRAEIFLVLLKHGADVNARDIHGNTPLAHQINCMSHTWSAEPSQDVHLLLEWGTDPNLCNYANQSVLDMIRLALRSDDCGLWNKYCMYEAISVLADHRKTIDTLYASLPTFSRDLVALVADYHCGGHGVNKAGLAALVAEFKGELERSTGRKDLLL
jgi:hypothetical protein